MGLSRQMALAAVLLVCRIQANAVAAQDTTSLWAEALTAKGKLYEEVIERLMPRSFGAGQLPWRRLKLGEKRHWLATAIRLRGTKGADREVFDLLFASRLQKSRRTQDVRLRFLFPYVFTIKRYVPATTVTAWSFEKIFKTSMLSEVERAKLLGDFLGRYQPGPLGRRRLKKDGVEQYVVFSAACEALASSEEGLRKCVEWYFDMYTMYTSAGGYRDELAVLRDEERKPVILAALGKLVPLMARDKALDQLAAWISSEEREPLLAAAALGPLDAVKTAPIIREALIARRDKAGSKRLKEAISKALAIPAPN